MTSRVVTYAQVECDTCGRRRDGISADATAERITAAAEGWKYAGFNIKGKGLQKRVPTSDGIGFTMETVPRHWDSCPDCPLPTSADEAAEIRNARKVYVKGKWIDREDAPAP